MESLSIAARSPGRPIAPSCRHNRWRRRPPPVARARPSPVPWPVPAERGGDPEVVRESQRRRYKDVTLVDKVLDLDAKWREGEEARAGCCGRRRVHAAAPSSGTCTPAALEWMTGRPGARGWHVQSQTTKGAVCLRRRRCPRAPAALLHVLPAARGKLDGLNMDFNRLNKEIGTLRKVCVRRKERKKERKKKRKYKESKKECALGFGGGRAEGREWPAAQGALAFRGPALRRQLAGSASGLPPVRCCRPLYRARAEAALPLFLCAGEAGRD